MIRTFHIDLKLAPPYERLHCTLVHWFECDYGASMLVAALTPVLERGIPRVLFPGLFDYFGKERDRLATRIFSYPLQAPHDAACDVIEQLGGRFLEPQWVRRGYSPHVTARGDLRLPEGDYVVATQVRLRWVPDPSDMSVERVVLHSWPIPRK